VENGEVYVITNHIIGGTRNFIGIGYMAKWFYPELLKVEVVIPSILRVPFVSLLASQTASALGARVVGGGREIPRINKDLIHYQISVEGPNKDVAFAFVNYLYEIEKAYTIELTCVICGNKWVECRDTHYNNHLDGSRDFCKGCKIHE
jgi:Pyruvate/2-oxoacid:ferredoxin oxidoreductase delta subunit